MFLLRLQFCVSLCTCIDCDRLDQDASLKKRVITIAVSSNMVAEHGCLGEQLAHKKAVGSPHAAWRIIARLERTETSDDNEEQAASARKSVGNVEPELLEIYDGILTLMEEKLDSDENVVTQRRMRRTSSRREFWGATESSCCQNEGFVLLALAGPPRRLAWIARPIRVSPILECARALCALSVCRVPPSVFAHLALKQRRSHFSLLCCLFAAHVASPLHTDLMPCEGDDKCWSPKTVSGGSGLPRGSIRQKKKGNP